MWELTLDKKDKMTLEEINKLTEKELRIKVAKLLGWTLIHTDHEWQEFGEYPYDAVVGMPKGGVFVGSASYDELPEYTSDLNACRKMEETLDTRDQMMYVARISEILSPAVCPQSFRMLHATARQRCEAFVMTIKQ